MVNSLHFSMTVNSVSSSSQDQSSRSRKVSDSKKARQKFRSTTVVDWTWDEKKRFIDLFNKDNPINRREWAGSIVSQFPLIKGNNAERAEKIYARFNRLQRQAGVNGVLKPNKRELKAGVDPKDRIQIDLAARQSTFIIASSSTATSIASVKTEGTILIERNIVEGSDSVPFVGYSGTNVPTVAIDVDPSVFQAATILASLSSTSSFSSSSTTSSSSSSVHSKKHASTSNLSSMKENTKKRKES